MEQPAMELESIKWDKKSGDLQILDQTALPQITRYICINNVQDAWEAINKMQVRGAPAIAIVACLSLATDFMKYAYEQKQAFYDDITNKLNYLMTARPTAVNLKTSADYILEEATKWNRNPRLSLKEMKENVYDELSRMYKYDIMSNKTIGFVGARAIRNALQDYNRTTPVRILTHCNTGSLATAGYGTALGVIRYLHKRGELEHVYFTETRPYNQGARLTAYELMHDKIPSTLICDNMVAAVMKTKDISAVVVGADRIAKNGDTANKIGTLQIAILAKYFNIPFYVAVPMNSVDFNVNDGDGIIIEERPEQELCYINGQRIAPEGVKCWNPSFDVTPANLITAYLTDCGIYTPWTFKIIKKREEWAITMNKLEKQMRHISY